MKAKLELTSADLVEAVTEYAERRGYVKAGKVEFVTRVVSTGDQRDPIVSAVVEGAVVEVTPKRPEMSSAYEDR